jgi:hypothetical protein
MAGGVIALVSVMGALAAAGCSGNTDSQPGAPAGTLPPGTQAQIQQRANDMAAEAAKAKAAAAAGAQGQH